MDEKSSLFFHRLGAFPTEIHYANKEPESNSFYITKNGLCLVNLIIEVIIPVKGNSYVSSNDFLPRPLGENWYFGGLGGAEISQGSGIAVGVSNEGSLFFRGGKANTVYLGQFIYPIE